jgi:hypothetical protein
MFLMFAARDPEKGVLFRDERKEKTRDRDPRWGGCGGIAHGPYPEGDQGRTGLSLKESQQL